MKLFKLCSLRNLLEGEKIFFNYCSLHPSEARSGQKKLKFQVFLEKRDLEKSKAKFKLKDFFLCHVQLKKDLL